MLRYASILVVLAMVIAWPAKVQADWLANEERVDLYETLIIQASRSETAERLLWAAYDDNDITYAQYKRLMYAVQANHAAQ